ncbi:efflux RND transporter permease subunit [Thermus thermamylovorans]|uniref:Efflux RND transporter permease subunit n=1 Tax=Thermus thermamylovorans TaxID=2509362 RepID=A0A4Q9B855_9DEIN|nr:efflux RND transporter permease subunit [Thermus thermamylovorans]TBH21027.1 efflux RND transporter permease subunit [Thermus thermamylovorans]
MRENRLVSFFVERFVFATALFLGVVLVGLLLGSRLGVELLPRFTFPVVAVTASYPGAGPEEVVEEVVRPLEDALATLAGVDQIGANAGEGFALIFVQFQQGVNVDQALVEVSQKVAAVRDRLPRDASAPVVQKFDPTAFPILFLALEGPGASLAELGRLAEEGVKPRLQQVPGVAEVRLAGAPREAIRVYLDPDRLRLFGVSPLQVSQAIGQAAVSLPLGSLEDGRRQILTLRSTPRTPEEVAEVLVDPVRGLRVRDLGRVSLEAEGAETLSRFNGRPVVQLAVVKTPEGNAVAVADGVLRQLAEIPLPEGYRILPAFDTTEAIRNAVRDTGREVLLASLAVALTVLLFLGQLNSVFSVLLAIPITLSGALLLFGVLGFTFNLLTLLALIVAVGIVVDDSIVVTENIDRYRKMGLPPKEAVIRGASEVSAAVGAATLSLLAVFLPISFLPGLIGDIFRQFALGVAAAIAVSYLEAFLFLTVRLAYLPDPEPPPLKEALRALRLLPQDLRFGFREAPRSPLFWALALGLAALLYRLQPPLALLALLTPLLAGLLRYGGRLFLDLLGALVRALWQGVQRGTDRVASGYVGLLDWTLGRPWLPLGLGLLFFASGLLLLPRIPFSFVAASDTGRLTVTLRLPEGTPLLVADGAVRRLEALFLADPAVKSVLATTGARTIGGLGAANPARGELQVTLRPKRERDPIRAVEARLQALGEEALRDFPGASLRVFAQTGPEAGDADLQLTLTAPSRALLEERVPRILEAIQTLPYVEEARSTLDGAGFERVFRPDPARLAQAGLTPQEVALTLRAYLAGVEAATARGGEREYPILVQADPLRVRSEGDLLALPIFSPARQAALPLSQVGRFTSEPAPTTLSRLNGGWSAGVNLFLRPEAPGQFQVQAEIRELLEGEGLLAGLSLVPTGIASLTQDLAELAPFAFALALVLNYLVIASQFNAWRFPLYLFLPVPLAVAGALWGVYLLGLGLDVISVLGLVILIGLVTKNAILLLDFTVRRLEATDLRTALLEAARLRFRPILMTTLTLLVISLPILLSLGEGTEYRRPLGAIILGGVSTSALLTLFVVPAAFYAFEGRRRAKRPREEAPALR